MDISSSAEFAADPDRVHQMLLTKEYLDQVCVASHAVSYDCQVEGSTTRCRRELPAPDQARKFTGPTLTVVEEVVWGAADERGVRTGQVSLTVPGQPMTMDGTVTLAPGGTGSRVELKANLKVNIPLLGKKLEQAAAPAVLEGLQVQESVGRDWLANAG